MTTSPVNDEDLDEICDRLHAMNTQLSESEVDRNLVEVIGTFPYDCSTRLRSDAGFCLRLFYTFAKRCLVLT